MSKDCPDDPRRVGTDVLPDSRGREVLPIFSNPVHCSSKNGLSAVCVWVSVWVWVCVWVWVSSGVLLPESYQHVFVTRHVCVVYVCVSVCACLTRIYCRPVPVPVLFLLVLGFGRFASSACVCVCVCVCHDLPACPHTYPPFVQARPCLSMGWALKRCFGTAALQFLRS
jgi:hypothetical protein